MNKLASFGDLAAVLLTGIANWSGRKLESDAREPNSIVSNTLLNTDTLEERLFYINFADGSKTYKDLDPTTEARYKGDGQECLTKRKEDKDTTTKTSRNTEITGFVKYSRSLGQDSGQVRPANP